MNKGLYIRCKNKEEQDDILSLCLKINNKFVSEGMKHLPNPIISKSSGSYFVTIKGDGVTDLVNSTYEDGLVVLVYLFGHGLKED